MIRYATNLVVQNAKAEQFYDFMINPNNENYCAWWPEEHLKFYITKSGDERHLGDEVYFDEYLGESRRLKFFADVITANRPTNIVWQMKKFGIRFPAFLSLEFTDIEKGLKINHELRIGFGGIGKILNPLIRIYFTKSFANALEKHCLEEWPRLTEYFMDNTKEEMYDDKFVPSELELTELIEKL